MNFSDITSSVSERLREEIHSSRAVHVYLFTGPAGTGKRTLADICAQALFCRSDGERPCGVCPSCQRFLSGNHPDVLYVEGEKSIGVDEIRLLIERLATQPYEGDRHVVLIKQADKMTPQAQNALLKTLEEPSGRDMFFLVSPRLNAMLPTVISRCRVVRFTCLTMSETEQALRKRGIDAGRARLLAGLSQGSVGRALEMNESEAWWQLREATLRAFSMLHDKQDVSVAAFPLTEKREQAGAILDILELCARDLMVMKDAGTGVIQTDIEDILAQQRFDGSRMLESIMNARKMLQSNVAWQSVLEMLFFELAGG